jgi:hypothetical protein
LVLTHSHVLLWQGLIIYRIKRLNRKEENA